MPEKGFWFLRVAYLEWRGRKGGKVPSIASLASVLALSRLGFYEVTEAEVRGTKMAGIKKRRVAERAAPPPRRRDVWGRLARRSKFTPTH